MAGYKAGLIDFTGMNPLKKLAGETALYGLSSIIGRAIGFLLVPFYTGIFIPAEYGIVTQLYAYVGFLNVLYTYGMETAFFRFANKAKEDTPSIYNNTFTLILASSIFLSLLLIATATPIINYLGYPGKENYVIWLAITIAIDAIVAIPFAKLRLEKKAAKFASIRLFNILLNVGLNLFFLLLCPYILENYPDSIFEKLITPIYNPEFGVGYVFLSNLIANATLILLLRKEIFNIRLNLDWGKLKPMLIYAYPLLFMGLAGMTNELLDRILLPELLPENFYPGRSSQAALGIYGACYKLSLFITLSVQAFRYAAEPFFFSSATDKNSPALFAKIMNWFIIFCVLTFIVVSINLDLFGMIVLQNPAYYEGLNVVPYLLLANVFLGIYYNLSIWFKLTDKTNFGTLISFGGAFLTIVLNVILIPFIGYLGCAIATLVCYAFMAIVCYWLGAKYYPIPYRVGTAITYLGVGSLLAWIGYSFVPEDFILKYGLRLALICIFLALVVLLERKSLPFQLARSK